MSPPRIALLGIMLESNAFAPPATEADFRRHYYREGEALLEDARAPVSAMPREMAAFLRAMDATGPWEPVPLLFANNPPWGPAEWPFIASMAPMRSRQPAMKGHSAGPQGGLLAKRSGTGSHGPVASIACTKAAISRGMAETGARASSSSASPSR